jgi:hypothetical protein
MRRPSRQDAALAHWRQARAVELAISGHDYATIAKEVGYSNRGTAWRTVQKALRQRTVEGVDQLREVEVERLDALLRAHWESAIDGDVVAANVVLRVIDQRVRLLGLEWTDATSPGPVSIVLGAG